MAIRKALLLLLEPLRLPEADAINRNDENNGGQGEFLPSLCKLEKEQWRTRYCQAIDLLIVIATRSPKRNRENSGTILKKRDFRTHSQFHMTQMSVTR